MALRLASPAEATSLASCFGGRHDAGLLGEKRSRNVPLAINNASAQRGRDRQLTWRPCSSGDVAGATSPALLLSSPSLRPSPQSHGLCQLSRLSTCKSHNPLFTSRSPTSRAALLPAPRCTSKAECTTADAIEEITTPADASTAPLSCEASSTEAHPGADVTPSQLTSALTVNQNPLVTAIKARVLSALGDADRALGALYDTLLNEKLKELRHSIGSFAVCTLLSAFVLLSASSSLALTQAPPRKLQPDEAANVRLFNDNTPSVVYITNLAVRRDAFTLDVLEVPQGSGSGFIWDNKGNIVTNFHVIRGASDLRVTLSDQSVYPAKIVGFDQDKDVAVLHIDAPEEKLRPLSVGSSSDLMVGQKVYAIGNPFGLDHTLTVGVISGLRREISSAATGRPIQDVIQTDAAINPGNSGGPLLDSSGYLIGINTAIYSPSGASAGVGFSIPVDTVSGIVDQIVTYGKVTRPVLGISFAPEQAVDQLGVSGVLVLDAPPSGPAGKAGLRPTTRDNYGRLILGDIITAIDGLPVRTGSDLYKILDKCEVGQTVEVQVLRGDDQIGVLVTLEPKA